MTSSDKTTVLVTAVGAPPGLNVLRTLVESQRYSIVACDADPRSPGLYQFGVPHVVVPAAVTNPDGYLKALHDLVKQFGIDVILPCIEGEVRLLSMRREEIEKTGVRILIPDSSTVEKALDKERATFFAQQCGLRVPATFAISQSASFDERKASVNTFMSQCSLPWIAKPIRGHGMNNVEILTSLSDAMPYVQSVQHDILLQEKIPGVAGSMYLVGLMYDKRGDVRRRFSSRSIRTLYPEGGPATAGISVKNESLVNDTERLINSLGIWRGPVNVEWMLDPRDGQFKFIEINPRHWGYGFLATGSGTNFPVTAVELALDRDVGPDPGFRAGVTMLRSTVDLILNECPFELPC